MKIEIQSNCIAPANKQGQYTATTLVAQINSLKKGNMSFQVFTQKCGNNSLKLINTAEKWSN